MTDKLTTTGQRTPLTPDLIKQLATVTPKQVNAALLDMVERNPVLAVLMLATTVEAPIPKGKRRNAKP